MLRRLPLLFSRLSQYGPSRMLGSGSTDFDDGTELAALHKYDEPHLDHEEVSDLDEEAHHQTRSRFVDMQKWTLYTHHRLNSPDVDPASTTVLLFPGQGSQRVGMARKLMQVPGVSRMFEVASQQLRMDLAKACVEGTAENLSRTVVCQPALYVTSLAAVQKLREDQPQAVERCVAAAGFSIGEISALVFAGCMTFEEGLHVVRVRAELMQRACDADNSGMVAVFLHRDTELSRACLTAREYCRIKLGMSDPVCQIANYLYDECRVVGGHTEALEFLAAHKQEFRIRHIKPIRVNGAFHTPLMSPVSRPLKNLFQRFGDTVKPPAIPVLSNVDALPYTSAYSIAKKLSKQVRLAVRWEQTLHKLYARPPGTPFPRTFEVGPGSQLGTMLKVVNRPAYESYTSVET